MFSRRDLVLLAALAIPAAACGDDGGTAKPDAANHIDAGSGSGSGSADANHPLVFLDPSTYADVFTVDAGFPYGVVARHEGNSDVIGSRWGRHGGPMVTFGVAGDGRALAVLQWIMPSDPTAAATNAFTSVTAPTGVAAGAVFTRDGMIDLPFGPYALLAYPGKTGPAYAGEALLYSPTYDAVTSRAYVNGWTSATGVTDGTKQVVVYSGLSPLADTASASVANGLYAAQICSGKVAPTAPCTAAAPLATWTGGSGPVAADADGNVFVGASVTGGAHTAVVYGVTQAQALAGAAVTAPDLADADGGTEYLTALAPTATADGWVLTQDFGQTMPAHVVASPYKVASGALARGASTAVANVFAITQAVREMSTFADPDGHLWVGLTTDGHGYYLELARKP